MMKYACNSFVSVETPVELIEKIAMRYEKFEDFINATRKRNVRKNGVALVLVRILEMIAYNYNELKNINLDIRDEENRYNAFGKAGMLFEFSVDNNRNALMYGESKVGVRTLKAVVGFFEEMGWMSHQNGFCIRNNADGKNPYRLGLEYIDFNKFIEIYDEYFNELNELFEVVILECKVKKSCGVTVVKVAVAIMPVAVKGVARVASGGNIAMPVNGGNSWIFADVS